MRALSRRDPRWIVAAARYMACRASEECLTQKAIAEAADTTDVTLRNQLRDLKALIAEKDNAGG